MNSTNKNFWKNPWRKNIIYYFISNLCLGLHFIEVSQKSASVIEIGMNSLKISLRVRRAALLLDPTIIEDDPL